MINFCLSNDEKVILKNLIGKKLLSFRHDPLDKFGGETIYGRVELFFKDLILLINYDYEPYPLFENQDDDHPKFSVKIIKEEEAVSALKNTQQINIKSEKIIKGITLVEDYVKVEWNNKKDEARIMKAIIFKFTDNEIAFQGDYMIPLLDFIKGVDVKDKIATQADEFDDSETIYISKRFFVEV